MFLHKGCMRSMAGDFLRGLFHSTARLSSHARRSSWRCDIKSIVSIVSKSCETGIFAVDGNL